MSPAELVELCACLMVAVDSECLADWEFESLVGTSRLDARDWIESGLPGAELDESMLDRVVTLLSVFAGSTQALAGSLRADVIGHMIDKLVWSPDDARHERVAEKSAVTLREGGSALTRGKRERKHSQIRMRSQPAAASGPVTPPKRARRTSVAR